MRHPLKQSPWLFGAFLPLLASLTVAEATFVASPQQQSSSLELFSFDYTWQPARPVVNDTVVFQAAVRQSDVARLGLSDRSFRWYQQLPGSGYRLRHIGRSYTRLASEVYFEGRYRLRISVEQQQPQQQPQPRDSNLLVDVVKYVGLQRPVEIALLTNHTGGAISGNVSDDRQVIVCRFWGWPQVDSLQFLAPPGTLCDQRHFETAEAEPHIDLVIGCPKLLPGAYSCYGRNAVSAAQLACELSGPELVDASCHRPILDETESVSKDASSAELAGGQSSGAESASRQQRVNAKVNTADGNAGVRSSLSVAMTSCIATVLLVLRTR